MSVRVALVSDTHLPRGQRRLPVEHLRGADLIVHAGDLVAPAVLDELEGLGPPVHAVLGNNDVELARTGRLPESLELEVEGVRIAVLHIAGPADGRRSRLRRRFPGADFVVFGHSHVPLFEQDPITGFAIANPGSACDRRRQPTCTMAWLAVDGGDFVFELVDLGP